MARGRPPPRRRGRSRRAPPAAAGTRRWHPGSSLAGPGPAASPGRSAHRRRPASRRRRTPGRAASRSRDRPHGAPLGVRSMPPKWPPRAVGEPAMTIVRAMSRGYPAHTRRSRSPGHASCRHAPRRLRPRALLRPLGVRRRAPAVRVGRAGLPDGRPAGPRRRRDAGAVGRPDARLHRVDRPSAPASRDRRAVRRRSTPDDVLVFAGAEEAHLLPGQRPARAGRPRHRDLARLPEPVRGRAGDRRRRHPPRAARGRRAGRSTSSALRAAGHAGDAADRRQRPAQPDRDAARPGDVRRPRRRSPTRPARTCSSTRSIGSSSSTTPTGCRPAPMRSPRGISLGVMSKSFAMAGLRIGWLATHDRELLDRCARVQGLHDDLLVGAVRGARADRASRPRRRAGAVAGDRRGQPRAARRASSTTGRTGSRGSGRGRVPSASRG